MHKHQIDAQGRWLHLAEYTAPSGGDWDNPFALRVDQKVLGGGAGAGRGGGGAAACALGGVAARFPRCGAAALLPAAQPKPCALPVHNPNPIPLCASPNTPHPHRR